MTTQIKTIAGAGGGGGGGCFRAGTQVQLQHGQTRAIEDLAVGDEVLAFDERGVVHLAKVTQVHYHEEPQPILHVKFWRGEVYITPNHWVLNQYGNFTEMGSLSTHDALVDGMGHLRPVISAELVGHEPVWNLTVEPHHTFIADGVRVHNGGHRERYPVIAGAGGGGSSKGGGGGRASVEDADSLQSRAMVSLLDLIGEGQIGGLVSGAQSVLLNDTPLQNSDGSYNFSGVSWEARTGTQDQLPMAGFADVEAPYNEGVQVKYLTPHTVTVSNPNVDSVRVIVAVPSLMQQDTTTGDVHGTSVQYKFQVSTDGGPFDDVVTFGRDDPYQSYSTAPSGSGLTGLLTRAIYQVTMQTDPAPGAEVITMSGKTRSRYQRHHLISLPKPGNTWQVRMVRLTADSTSSALANDTYFDSYIEVVDSRLTYPNSALVGIRIDSAQFNQIPNRAYLVDGLYIRVPSNYDPETRTYTGVWNGTFKLAVSSNPAWVLYDVLSQARYGLGQYLNAANIDKAKLYQIGRYCDEMVSDGFGGLEPRFTINTAVQTQAEAFKLISDLCSVFRGMGFWNGSMVGFTQDAPSDPSMVFSQANVVDGLFNYTGSARKDRHSVALIVWNDPAENYKQKIEYVENAELIAKFGIRKIETVAFGCTSRGQAHRVGKWMLYTEQYESDLVQFKVGMDAAMVLPGEIVKIHDQYRAGKRMGGRLLACTSNSATLDSAVTLDGAGAVFSVRLPDGTFADRTILEGAGTYSAVTWSDPLPTVPVDNSIWLLAETDLQPMLARVVSVSQDKENPGQFTIAAIEHNPSKYAAIESDIKLEEPRTSIISVSGPVGAPSNLRVTESLYRSSVSTVDGQMEVSWDAPDDARFISYYQVSWRVPDGNWVEEKSTSQTNTVVRPILPGPVEVKVVAVNALGRSSQAVTLPTVLLGKTRPPSDVSDFSLQVLGSTSYLSWQTVPDLDADQYEIRFTPAQVGATWEMAAKLGAGVAHPSNGVSVPSMVGTWLIKVIDTSGIYSQNAALVVSNVANVANSNMVENLIEHPAFSGTKVACEEVNGSLTLSGSYLSMWANLTAVDTLRRSGGIQAEGEYLFADTVDIGGIATSRVSYLLEASLDNLVNVLTTWDTLASVQRITGTQSLSDEVRLQMRTTNDDPAGSATWSPWADLKLGDYTFRGAQFRLLLKSYATNTTPLVSRLAVQVDMPDRVDGQNDVVCPSVGLSVQYSPAFMNNPALAITGQGMATGDHFTLSGKSASGFTLRFFNSSGVAVARTFDWMARGYGYIN